VLVHARMPVVASEERRMKLAWWTKVGGGLEEMPRRVRVLAADVLDRKARDARGQLNVKLVHPLSVRCAE
jgi:hypothetical protein